ncbi:hypothetical protein F5Y16DRAFT_258952 [Xylariaceae sp. FL0255]|nr:hypothetical protein F5Y16DRAFT_258952 [Xylariaceae sp. FL0255]
MADLTEPPAVDSHAGTVDTRPESSPYTAISIPVTLRDKNKLYIPTSLLNEYPLLPSLCASITLEEGHILVHYLLTKTYQCLRPKGSSLQEQLVDEFTMSVRIYAIARANQLASLEELARIEMERLGDRLPTPLVFRLVQIAYPDPNRDDIWFSNYLKIRLRSFVDKPTASYESDFWDAKRETMPVSDLLFKNIYDLLHENVSTSRDSSNRATARIPESSKDVASIPERLGSPVPELEPEQEELSPPPEVSEFAVAEEPTPEEPIYEEAIAYEEAIPYEEPIPEEPVPAVEYFTSKKDKKKKKKKGFAVIEEPEVEDMPMAAESNPTVDNTWGSWR